ncbi:MAG: sugar ABC transporter permease [Microcella sp.]|uniref:carbohydrate ABC transporter permease n=1 Tax=Microcella sp. TaxID=1913979 RepID=UPI0024CDF9E3|nr:sugar ABC transporter permease [Microcella sp.]UYN83441.1 MAG: sugar ABC transporter permease [Microcella sp.]
MATQAPPKRSSKRPSEYARKEARAAWIMLTPWLLGLTLITAIPMLASLYLSFTNYPLLAAPRWVGFDNYVRLFDDPRFLASIGVTFRYVFISVPLQLAFALGLALLLNRGLSGLKFYRSALYLPSLLGASVTIAILWRQVFGQNGIFNDFLALFGIQGISWIGNPDWALSTLIVLNVWTFGSPMVIFLAGLRQIPKEYYEAASVDGAPRMSQFFHITLPLLTPVVFFNVILQFIHAFQAFTPSYIISGGSGGPVDSTLFYTLYLYQRGFTQFQMGYASAMAWILLLIIGLFTAANFIGARYWVFYGDEK